MKSSNKITKSISLLEISIMIIATFAFAYLVAIPEISLVDAAVTSCCEKTDSGAWCQNAPSEECLPPPYKSTPTSCDSTAYCRLGCCYDSQEGICMENTPERVCTANNGTWTDSASCSIPQCNLGCCVLNGQAAFTTLTRCKKLSAFYAITTDFRSSITTELQCLTLASLEDKGACVYDVDYSTTCKYTTRNDCNNLGTSSGTITSGSTFYKDKLCSAEELATNCGPTEQTTCYEGRVYFLDSCGNIANVYDSARIKDKVYWDKKISVEESCALDSGLSNAASCGNCDYLSGSRCGDVKLAGTRATYGDYICRDLNCIIDGTPYNHGETWCSTDKNQDSVGSRYFRHICADGEEIIEPCADFRNQVCTQDVIETSAGDFSQGGCTVNRWQDCTSQDNKEDCLNTDQRDCKWTSNKDESDNSTLACVPLNAPGFKFWTDESEQICNQASVTCVVTYEEGLLGGKDCKENCECLDDSWKKEQEAKCQALGDCGFKLNYVGVQGKAKTTSPGKQTSSFSGSSGQFTNPTANIFLPIVQAVLFLFSDVKGVSGAEWTKDTTAGIGWWKIEVDGKNYKYYEENKQYYEVGGSSWGSLTGFAGVPAFSSSTTKNPGDTNNPTEAGWLATTLGLEDANAISIANGFQHAFMIAGAIQMFGSFMGFDETLTSALSKSTFAGMMAYNLANTFKEKIADTFLGKLSPGTIGLGVGILVFLATYKEEETKTIEFECNSFEAPIGTRDCEKCNDNELGCSEYRCKSLGQNCVLVNEGTKNLMCVGNNTKDVNSPIISTWNDVLTKNHKYTPDTSIRPPAIGVIIENNEANDKCLKAFTPITFGITTDEPTQCKIDYNHTTNFEDMKYFMSGSSLYRYNHTETLNLPSPEHLIANEPTLKHDGKFNLFIRCKDANGNYNVDEFAISLCVEKGPDILAPIIKEVNPIDNAPVQYELSSIQTDVYTNEPAECRWSRLDLDFENMEKNMTCNTNIESQDSRGYYRCVANLTGLENRKENVYYFRCKDQPPLGDVKCNEGDRNCNRDSFVYTLRGSSPLDIIKVSPDKTTISGSSNVIPVDLQVETSNGESNRGDSTCYYSNSSSGNFVEMFETGTNIHKQRQDLTSGKYTYYFKCVDLGGNSAESSVTFNVYVDNEAPKIARVYKDSSRLKLITNENATCYYSLNSENKCNFLLTEGISLRGSETTEHYAEWISGKTYYIKCEDEAGNQLANTACTITVNMPSI